MCHVNQLPARERLRSRTRRGETFAANFGVECRVFRKEVELIAENGNNLVREAGREVRREAFEQMCAENGGNEDRNRASQRRSGGDGSCLI